MQICLCNFHSYSCFPNLWFRTVRGSVRSTRGLGRTMTARGQSIGVSIGMLPQTLIMSITVQKTSKYYTTEFDLEEGFLNGACISIYNLPENIAWQSHRPEARGPLKSGAWGGRPTCHPQTPPLRTVVPSHKGALNSKKSAKKPGCENCLVASDTA